MFLFKISYILKFKFTGKDKINHNGRVVINVDWARWNNTVKQSVSGST